jgi:hypothetical protein
MSNMEVELNGADQTALTEADTAAINEDKDFVPSEEEDNDSSEVDSLLGKFSAEVAVEATEKAAARKALKEMLTSNGFALRTSERSLHFPIFERR